MINKTVVQSKRKTQLAKIAFDCSLLGGVPQGKKVMKWSFLHSKLDLSTTLGKFITESKRKQVAKGRGFMFTSKTHFE